MPYHVYIIHPMRWKNTDIRHLQYHVTSKVLLSGISIVTSHNCQNESRLINVKMLWSHEKKKGFIRNVSPCNSHCLWSLLAFCPELPESNTPSSTQNPSDVAVALHPPLPRPQQPLSPSRSIPTSATPGTHHPPRQLEKWCFRKKKNEKKRKRKCGSKKNDLV